MDDIKARIELEKRSKFVSDDDFKGLLSDSYIKTKLTNVITMYIDVCFLCSQIVNKKSAVFFESCIKHPVHKECKEKIKGVGAFCKACSNDDIREVVNNSERTPKKPTPSKKLIDDEAQVEGDDEEDGDEENEEDEEAQEDEAQEDEAQEDEEDEMNGVVNRLQMSNLQV